MGGLFSAPKPVVVQTQPAAEAVPASAPPEQQGEAARVAAEDRARRGLAGTIATSARGVLDPLPSLPRKSLLGE
ncbi:hypothetical protein [Roseicella frigidaeris]|uniref:Uncharacterized protein n=1 Tax=Roseicella frigidaeris TaxID=2230885 RepID=A0A327M7N3_9PROT|nr:hypothetical protein [Roseicella frigidaeris]RAI58749.1 hypothetical protein DOO78_11745 [Roseicella frigidaeris]